MPSTRSQRLLIFGFLLVLGGCATEQPLSSPSTSGEPEITLPEPALGQADAKPPEAPSSDSAVSADATDASSLEPSDSEQGLLPASSTVFRPKAPIRADVSDLLKGLPKGAKAAFVVVDLERGDIIAEHNIEQTLIPASTAKLATALVALDVLGPRHRYKTELHMVGTVKNGELDGDLILKGGGDPLLDIPDLITLAGDLKRRDIHKITGRFLIDDTLLPRFTEIAATQPLEAPYNPGIGALSLAFNRVHLSWRSGAGPVVETVPSLNEARFEKAARDGLPPSGINLKQRQDGRVLWQLADRGKRRSKKSLPVKDPGLHAGSVFADIAAMQGIDLPAPTRAALPPKARLIATHKSRPLLELVRDMLWYSNNLMAELIGLSVARESDPEVPSLEASGDIMRSHLKRLVPEAEWSKTVLGNHSGLNSGGRMTPLHLAAILQKGWDNESLVGLLPVSGWSGTLTRRFTGQDEALRVWAKTGSLNYANSLAGFMLSPTYGPTAFAIMISDLEARATYDARPHRTRKAEAAADKWHGKTQAIIDRIVEDWLQPSPAVAAIQEAGQG